MNEKNYSYIIVESYRRGSTLHIRPCPGQDPYTPEMGVECSKELMEEYPEGTKFRIKAKITSREGSDPFVYSHYLWDYEVIDD